MIENIRKFSCLLLLAALLAVTSFSYSFTQKITKVNGAVALGFTRARVLNSLGKPASPQRSDFFYENSDVSELIVSFNEKTDLVEAVIVRGKNPKYSVEGVSVGANKDLVRKTFGGPEKIIDYKKSNEQCWYYPSKNVSFAFKGDNVSSFGLSSSNVGR